MTDGRGYLLPDVIDPGEMDCIKVYYPKSELYLSALLGSLGFLGTWVAWEKDGTTRARDAAQVWKTANDLTYDGIGQGCTDGAECDLCDMTRDELIQIIEETMTISINNNVCCCCCGGSSGGVSVPTDIPLGTNPPPPPNPDTTGDLPTTYVSEDQCAIANYMLLNWRNALIGIANGDYTQDRYTNWVTALFADVWDWVTDKAQVVLETIGVLSAFSAADAGTVAAEIDAIYNQLQCRILEGGTQGEVAAALNGIMENMALSAVQTYQAKKIMSLMPLTAVFDTSVVNAQESPVGAEYYARGCPECVNLADPPFSGETAYFDTINNGTGETYYGDTFAHGEQVAWGTPYRLVGTYYDVPSQSVDGFRINWRMNDGQGGRYECDMKIVSVENWNARPNGYVDSVNLIAADDSVTESIPDNQTIPSDATYSPVWQGHLLSASENWDQSVQYDTFVVHVIFYPGGYLSG